MLCLGVFASLAVPLTDTAGPVLAARLATQRPLVAAVAATKAAALLGLLLAPHLGWVWICALGLATGSAFPLAFTLLGLRSPTPQVAARLSGMAQTGGYLIAGAGSLVIGLLHAFTGTWGLPLLLLALLVPETVFGLLAGRPAFVHAGHSTETLRELPRPPAVRPTTRPLRELRR
ncbi:hypothetical protein [Streptomyces roseochromogenus]|uniref:Major facilitator superfamily (MFS) profile domain-containing protein n=1 Tax=Streptomyces roseochromogenus subsp. oscitans DS 12.976 TaxID=1352936 RepID=V6KY92_STRRC|nr:hypothetical protein [Streptomyces roseochromogenus]EST36406.1 hypothetical protein M878_02155 [Streptomyces roseochromogenus subsp. oscitans DS 12.976]